MRNNPLNGLNMIFSDASISEVFQGILSCLCAKFGDLFAKCTISLNYAHIHRNYRLPRRRLIFLSNRLLQNLSANNTSLLILLKAADHPQCIYHERPWMIPCPQIGWFEEMLGNNSQSRYWKEHF